MFLSFDLAVPANTPASSPLEVEALVPPGIVQQVDVQFPSGCVGLVHTLCRRENHQVWPTNPDSNFHSNGQTLTWQDDYELDDAPFLFRLVAWNLDDTFAHTISWRFALRRFPQEPRQQAAENRFEAAIATLEVDV